MGFEDYQVGSLPTVLYVPQFVTEAEEAHLLAKCLETLQIYEAPSAKWKSLKNRRLQNWGGVVHEKGLLPQERIGTFLCKAWDERFVLLLLYWFQNPHQDGPAYFPVAAILSLGSPAVMDFTPHSRLRASPDPLEDEGGEGRRHPSSETLEAETDKWIDDHHRFSVALMPRSLLIFKDDAYLDYLHGIKDAEVHDFDKAVNVQQILDAENTSHAVRSTEIMSIHRTSTRISLTCRLVLKVHKNLFKF
ncbi:unnamed protein product [Linum tenue]|uniref:Uncharacterized protein n=1 Tax=Linum tenue TaxID=586396 RepID=A0AAV0NG54_9ROSI|nr:unnamed protein product [Linum tenue]